MERCSLDLILELTGLKEILRVLTDLTELHLLENAFEDDVESLNGFSFVDGWVLAMEIIKIDLVDVGEFDRVGLSVDLLVSRESVFSFFEFVSNVVGSINHHTRSEEFTTESSFDLTLEVLKDHLPQLSTVFWDLGLDLNTV